MNRLGLRLKWCKAARKLSSRDASLKSVYEPTNIRVQSVTVALTVDKVDLIHV